MKAGLIRVRFAGDVVAQIDQRVERLQIPRAAVLRAFVALAMRRNNDAGLLEVLGRRPRVLPAAELIRVRYDADAQRKLDALRSRLSKQSIRRVDRALLVRALVMLQLAHPVSDERVRETFAADPVKRGRRPGRTAASASRSVETVA